MIISDILQPTHLLLLLAVALLVLGPKRLPEAARSIGRGLRDFKTAVNLEPEGETPPTRALERGPRAGGSVSADRGA
jgi:sec-independent protein translocase protein TatA